MNFPAKFQPDFCNQSVQWMTSVSSSSGGQTRAMAIIGEKKNLITASIPLLCVDLFKLFILYILFHFHLILGLFKISFLISLMKLLIIQYVLFIVHKYVLSTYLLRLLLDTII